MTRNKGHSRKTNRVVRTPATRFGHLKKQMGQSKTRPCKGVPSTKR